MSPATLFVRKDSLVQRVLRQVTGRDISDLPDLGAVPGTGVEQCRRWLANKGVPVLMALSSRAGDFIIVPDCPAVYQAFDADHRSSNRRSREGIFNVYRWFAVRFGVTVMWEQYECVA